MLFQDKVVYQIYPKSFYDSNGDGIGDLPGVTLKLDYLASLGVDALWLTPFFLSPQRDNGYDVQDYYSIQPEYGTMADAETMIRKAQKRGLGIMLDMVFNHTSTKHVWFQKALQGEKEYQDYYIFQEGDPTTPPNNWQSKFGGSAWAYAPEVGKWYLHLFDVTQADLNWDNPKVREELKKVILFWKEKGVTGFRFDVINLISKPSVFPDDDQGDGRRFYTDGVHVHEYIQELVRDTGIDNMITVGEMNSTSLQHCIRYSCPDNHELSMTFNFHHLKVDYAGGYKWKLQAPDIQQLKDLFQTWQEGMQSENGWSALFYCNHDQPRIVSRLGDDKELWKESAKMLAMSIHLMRGTPYIYQGEELGMTNAYFDDIHQYRDVESLNYFQILTSQGLSEEEALEILQARSRDNSRTPMQWSEGKSAGFTTAKEPWIPVPQAHLRANVEDEEKDPDSILNFYKTLVKYRKENPVISQGTIRFFSDVQAPVLAYEREWEGEKLAVYCNFSKDEQKISIDQAGTMVLDSYGSAPQRQEHTLILRPWEGCAWKVNS